MDKADAILLLLREQRVPRKSTTAARRLVRACTVLGITDPAERIRILCDLDYCDRDGTPFGFGTNLLRVW